MKPLLIRLAGGAGVAAGIALAMSTGALADSNGNWNHNQQNYNQYSYSRGSYDRGMSYDYSSRTYYQSYSNYGYGQGNSQSGMWYNDRWYSYSQMGYWCNGCWVPYSSSWSSYDWQQWESQGCL